MPDGPRLRRWRMVSPSGPGAVEEPEATRASETIVVLKGWKRGSSGLSDLIFLRILRNALLRGGEEPVNCLQKCAAIEGLEVRVLLPKLMNWLGECEVFLPESVRRRDQKRVETCFRLLASTLSIQVRLASDAVTLLMLSFRRRISGEAGEALLMESRSSISAEASGERPGM